MVNTKKNMIITILVFTVLTLAVLLTVTSQYKDYYVKVGSKNALEEKALFFQNYSKYVDLDYEENPLFPIDYIVFTKDFDKTKLSEKKLSIRNGYENTKLGMNTVSMISNDFGDFCIYPISVQKSSFLEHVGIATPLEGEEEYIDVIIYAEIDFINLLLLVLSVTFAVALFAAIIFGSLSGFYLGSKIEKDQDEIKHLFQNSSHELKTPLMSIEGYAKGIETGVIADYKMASKVIIKQSKKMQKLIDEILNISKLESKNYVLKEDTIDIRDIIDDSMQNFRQKIKKKNLNVEVLIDEEHPLIVGDELQLYKAINTVIDNSFKFAETEVIIKTFVKEVYLCIEVFNDGKPIKKENLAHIFERFYSKDDFSSGIGLAMAKEIVELSGGEIAAINKINGVAFMITLPRDFSKTK